MDCPMRGLIPEHMFGPMALRLFHPEFFRRFEFRIHICHGIMFPEH